MNTCKTCRWWNPLTDREHRGVCGGIETTWEWRFRIDDPTPESLAIMMDSNAQLVTYETFGCALHEAGESTETGVLPSWAWGG